MNRKLTFLLLLSLALFLIALTSKNGRLAILAVPGLVYVFSGILLSPTQISLRAERQIHKTEHSSHGNFTQDLTLYNQGAKTLHLQIQDALFPAMQLTEGSLSQNLLLAPGESYTLTYQFHFTRGSLVWKNTHVIVSDPLYIYQQHLILPALATLTVKPAISKLRHIPLHPQKTLHLTGNIPARLAGSGTDMWGVRQYQSGDQLRRLNWRKIARNPHQLYSNEFEQEEITDIGLILNARSLGHNEEIENELLEKSIHAVASLADIFLHEGNRVGLLIFGQKLVHLFPGYGKNQLNKILFNLALVEQRPYISLNHLQFLPFRIFPAHAQIIMVSAYNANDLPAYKQLRAYGYPLMLLSPDPCSIITTSNLDFTDHLINQAANLDRQISLKSLTQLGVSVVNWPIQHPLNSVLQSSLRQFQQAKSIGSQS
ncbi:MAG: DUF58 domain-containing protein [Anaerolineaceae bacterium]|nr:DUF58 domain-containing protein [Anaerolineaceae bacterium]